MPWGKFQNNDRYINVEVDFDPELDELFSVTTSKQQIVPSDRMWELLDNAGVRSAIKNLREQFGNDDPAHQEEQENEQGDQIVPVAPTIMQEATKFLRQKPLPPETVKERKREYEEEVKKKAEAGEHLHRRGREGFAAGSPRTAVRGRL